MQPHRKCIATLIGVFEGSGIGPFVERGLDEAFGLAVGLRGKRLSPNMGDAELVAGTCEGF
jgi:hypothetical protein